MSKLPKFIAIPVSDMELALVRKAWGSSPEKAAGLAFEKWALARILASSADGPSGLRKGARK